MKIRPVGAELYHADRQTDTHDTFRYFANVSKTQCIPRKKASQLKSFKEVVLSSVNYTKPTSALCGQRKNSLKVKASGIHPCHSASKC